MGDYPEMSRAAMNLADAIATDTATVRRGEAKGLNQGQIRALADLAPDAVDDEVPPTPPTGILVTPGRRLFVVSWAEPPVADYVTQAEVKVLRVSNGALVATHFTFDRNQIVPSLDPYQPDGSTREQYTVEVRLIDQWGRVGDAAESGPHEPLLSATDEIDIAKLAILDRIQGLLPNANLATIEDAALLGSGIVTADAMAAGDAAFISAWIEDAAIGGAKIGDLSVDTLTGGTIDTDFINIAAELSIIQGGTFYGGGTKIDNGGLELSEVAGGYTAPSNSSASKITPPGDWAAFGFVSNAQERSVHIRVENAGAGINSELRVEAVGGDPSNSRTSRLVLRSGAPGDIGRAYIFGILDIEKRQGEGGSLNVAGSISVDGNLNVGGSLNIPASSIDTRELKNLSVTRAKIAVDAVGDDEIGSVPFGKVTGFPSKVDPRTHGSEAHSSGMKARPTVHGNKGAHKPAFQPKKAPKSTAFSDIPLDAQNELLSARSKIRNQRNQSVYGTGAVAELQHAILHLMRLAYDSPEMGAEAGRDAITADPRYRDVWSLMQTYPSQETAHYFNNRGPDIFVNGSQGTVGDTNTPWYPPKPVEVTVARAAVRSARTLTADVSDVAAGELMRLVVVGYETSSASYGTPSGWTPQGFYTAGGGLVFRVFNRQRQAGDAETVSCTVSGSQPIAGAVMAFANAGSLDTNNIANTGNLPETPHTATLFREQPGQGHMVVFAVEGGLHDMSLDPDLTERFRVDGGASELTLVVGVENGFSSDGMKSRTLEVSDAASGRWAALSLRAKCRHMTLDEALVEAD